MHRRSALAGGVLGTLVLTTIIRAASEMALTRMDLPLLLGTTVTDNRRKARAIGYVFHLDARHRSSRSAYAAFFRDHRPQHLVDRRARSARSTRVFIATVARQRAAADRPSADGDDRHSRERDRR